MTKRGSGAPCPRVWLLEVQFECAAVLHKRSIAARLRVWLWQGPGFEVAHTLGQTLPREKIPALQLSLDPSGRFRQDKVTLYSKVLPSTKAPAFSELRCAALPRGRAASALYLPLQRTRFVLELLWSLPGQKQGDYNQLVTPIQELKRECTKKLPDGLPVGSKVRC